MQRQNFERRQKKNRAVPKHYTAPKHQTSNLTAHLRDANAYNLHCHAVDVNKFPQGHPIIELMTPMTSHLWIKAYCRLSNSHYHIGCMAKGKPQFGRGQTKHVRLPGGGMPQ